MSDIENTSRSLRPEWLLPDAIERQEAEGQRQLLASTSLPTDMRPNEAAFTALGFTFGKVKDGDPLFREATLPAGWRREGTDHSMHSQILDERGVARVSVFYKAAFYDRRADLSLINVGRRISGEVIYGDEEVALPAAWSSLTAAERGEARADAEDYLRRAAEHPDIYKERSRAERFLVLAGEEEDRP